MPSFARKFAVDDLAKWDRESPGNAVRALFEKWCLPGEAASSARMLRLGLRDGYLNFYVKGQSVAKLSCGSKGPSVLVHNAYLRGRKGQTGQGDKAVGYKTFDATSLREKATASLIAVWIESAESYAASEKRFVDDLAAANPGVLDLEMGLPASDLPGSVRVAPRMDIVVAQRAGDAPLSIAFWEAKCANNPELRISGKADPRVVGQLETYVKWISEGQRVAEVQQAYKSTATTLLDLHRLYRDGQSDLECLKVWEALAALESPVVVKRPGIVIGNYWPAGYPESIASGRMDQAARSFSTSKNDHRGKLVRSGIVVHEVTSASRGAALPFLPPAAVTA